MIQHALGRYWAYASDYEVASCSTCQLSAMQKVHAAPGAHACPEPLQNGKTAGFDYNEKIKYSSQVLVLERLSHSHECSFFSC